MQMGLLFAVRPKLIEYKRHPKKEAATESETFLRAIRQAYKMFAAQRLPLDHSGNAYHRPPLK